MIITINDQTRSLNDSSTLFDLLQTIQLAEQRGIAVAVNAEVVARASWSGFNLQEMDQVTIIQATQGG